MSGGNLMHLSNALSLVTLMKYQSTWQSIHSFTLLPMILWVVIKATHLHPQFKAGKALLWTYSGSSIEEFSNWALVRYIQQTFTTADGLEHGCQQQPICESEPHYCRFLHCLAFQSVPSNISHRYAMLNAFSHMRISCHPLDNHGLWRWSCTPSYSYIC